MKQSKKYHYFYKITNLTNGHFYYGVHNTSNLNDGYMGSGKRLYSAYKKYGVENFSKEILKYFDTKEQAYQYEAEVVNEILVNDERCYNLVNGGRGSFRKECNEGKVRVKSDNTCLVVSKNDPRYTSGELHGITKGLTKYINKITGETKLFRYGDVDLSLWKMWCSEKIVVKDRNYRYFQVDKNDIRICTGELTPIWKGRTHRELSKLKMSNTHRLNGDQVGEKNSQYGTCWIHNNEKSIKIKKENLEDYISSGWIRGRKMIF